MTDAWRPTLSKWADAIFAICFISTRLAGEPPTTVKSSPAASTSLAASAGTGPLIRIVGRVPPSCSVKAPA
jgi:hypothetical protein